MKEYNKSSLESILQEITPQEQERTDTKMRLAAKIADAMAAKGWNNKMLMDAMGKKNPSEITRWLSGTHNFTMDTLVDLGYVLDTSFFNLDVKEVTVQQFNMTIFSPRTQKHSDIEIINESYDIYPSVGETFKLSYNV